MGLDKAIEHGKEHREPYRNSKYDRSCQNHGSCSYCKGNRLANTNRKLEACKQELKKGYSDA